VLDNITAHGRNIYDKGLVDRRIYEIQAEIEQGNSGGPLIDKNGMVRGMVFGKSVSNDKIAYVILLKQLEPAIKKSLPLTASVSTGRCISQ
jgi:S1-C subfamily serine protease